MSQNAKPRSHAMLYVVTGLFAGVLLGFGTALFLQNRDINPMVPFRHDRSDTFEATSKEPQQEVRRRKSQLESVSNEPMPEAGDSLSAETTDPTDGETGLESSEDTLQIPATGSADVVLRDEMIGSRKIKVQWDEERPQKRNEGTDSLITGLTAVKPPEGIFPEYTVEFWRNPLNYKGYRISRDKLVIFGLPPEQPYQLRFTSGQLVLVAGKQLFHLRESVTFTPLIPKK